MNPIEFENNRYADWLESNKERRCQIRVLGQDDFILTGTFLGVSRCKPNELTDMAGFCINVPVYKLCMLVEDNGITPIWINTLLIDSISDIEFLD